MDVMLSSYFIFPFWVKYTTVFGWVPKFDPVMVIVDFKTGEDDVFEREVT